jgi:hypothetical protein
MRRRRIDGCLAALTASALLLAACGPGGAPAPTPTSEARPTATVEAPRPQGTPPTSIVRSPTPASAGVTTPPPATGAVLTSPSASGAAVGTPASPTTARTTVPASATTAVAATIGPPPTALPTAVPPTATAAPARTYPASLSIVTEATYTLDGQQVVVGLPAAYVDDPRVPEVIRDYLRAYQAADRAFETGDEALLAEGLTGPMLERELEGLRADKAKGQVVRVSRTHRVLAIYTIVDDQAGVYDAFMKANTIIDARTGQVLQTESPRLVRGLSALRRIDGVWKWYDARGFVE